ncbi:MAG TPA: hypothetical protein VMU53_07580 [Candidatus Sulfotelmatobacter sp.]|nr:hypothetical protein [Candidatus Sulfotelmatobacter sp.]
MHSSKSLLTVLLLTALPLAPLHASPKNKSKLLPKNQIVVSARRVNGSIDYAIGKFHYSKLALSEVIGELRLSSSASSGILIVLEDTMALSDIKDIPQMALDAGFKNVRVFVYWKGTGNMAELFFGPVVKHNLDHFPD